MKQLKDYGTGMKDIILNQLAKERDAAFSRMHTSRQVCDKAAMTVTVTGLKMRALIARYNYEGIGLHIDRNCYGLGA